MLNWVKKIIIKNRKLLISILIVLFIITPLINVKEIVNSKERCIGNLVRAQPPISKNIAESTCEREFGRYYEENKGLKVFNNEPVFDNYLFYSWILISFLGSLVYFAGRNKT